MTRRAVIAAALLLATPFVFTGCSTRKVATNAMADALAQGGGTYARDDDPELVRAATPFSLKLMESLLDENPEHAGLLTAAAQGFAQYAYAFVQQDADELESADLAAAEALRTRAKRLYLRAQRYGLRALESRHPGFASDPKTAAANADLADVPALYWTAVSWAGAIALGKDEPDLVGALPQVEALIDRALELDEAFDRGAIHTFLITYEMSRHGAGGDPAARARKHFDRAVELSNGQDAAPLVSLAEAVSIQKQDAAEFDQLLGRALAIDPDAQPDTRLANLVMQRRARWLLSMKDNLFLTTGE